MWTGPNRPSREVAATAALLPRWHAAGWARTGRWWWCAAQLGTVATGHKLHTYIMQRAARSIAPSADTGWHGIAWDGMRWHGIGVCATHQ